MTKSNALIIKVVFLIAVAVIISGQAVFGQTGTAAGGHDEIVQRLQEKLATIHDEVLTNEMTPILNETGEADLGAKLLESLLAGVRRLDGSLNLFDNPDGVVEASQRLEGCLNETDFKATLLQVYYDALSPQQRTSWASAGLARMNSVSKPVIDKLTARGFIRPARHVDSYRILCFKANEDILDQLTRQNSNDRLETMIGEAAKASGTSRSNSQTGYPDMGMMGSSMSSSMTPPMTPPGPPPGSPMSSMSPPMPGMPQPAVRPAELNWIEQVEGLVLGTATAEQVLPLCRLLAASIDSLLENQRNELAKLRQPIDRGVGMGRGLGSDYASSMGSEYGGSSMPPMSGPPMGGSPMGGYPGAGPSFRQSTVTPVAQVNVAGLFNSEIRMFMARNFKPMIRDAKTVTEKDTLIKAWCALSEGADFCDVCFTVLMVEEDAREEPPNTANPSRTPMTTNSAMTSNNARLANSWIEMLSVLSGYKSDDRVWCTAVGMSASDPTDLSIQMCFNIGKEMLTPIRNSLASSTTTSQSQVALIEATQYIGDPDAAAFLIPLLVSNDKAVVNAAADAIAAVGDRRASAALVKGLENPRLAETITGILKNMGAASTQDIVPMFKSGNPATDKFCVDILKESGDINTLYYLAAVLERYHNAPAKRDMPQAEKSEMLMLTMEAGLAIISRNMGKAPPSLTIPTVVVEDGKQRLDYTVRSTLPGGLAGMEMGMMGMGSGMSPGMGSGMSPGPPGMGQGGMTPAMPGRNSAMPSGMPGTSGADRSGATANMVPLEQLLMQPEDIQKFPDKDNDDKTISPQFVWLDRVYKVATKHIADSAELMKDVQSEVSGRKIGTDIRNERIDKEFFITVVNTSEEGLTAYLTSRNDQRKLVEQKDRVKRSLSAYQREISRMSRRPSSEKAFTAASTGVDPNATTATTGGLGGPQGITGSGTTRPATPSPLGGRL